MKILLAAIAVLLMGCSQNGFINPREDEPGEHYLGTVKVARYVEVVPIPGHPNCYSKVVTYGVQDPSYYDPGVTPKIYMGNSIAEAFAKFQGKAK